MKKAIYIPLMGLIILATAIIGYLIADIADVVPGILTAKPPVIGVEKNIAYQLDEPEVKKTGEFQLPNGPSPNQRQVKNLIDELERQISTTGKDKGNGNTGARLGVVVVNTKTGAVIGAKNAKVPMVPASSTKILAAVTSLMELGPNYRFETAVFQNGTMITLVAGGDIALNTGVSNPGLIYGHAGIASLAQQTAQKLASQGIKAVCLEFDNSLFGNANPLPAWVYAQTSGYTMNPTAIAFNGGIVPGGKTYDYYANPANAVLRQFTVELDKAGISVSKTMNVSEKSLQQQVFPVGGKTSSKDSTKKIASVKGAKLSELIYRTLKYSDNAMADSICRAATIKAGLPGSFPNQVKTVKNNLEKLKVGTQGLEIQDCSGLSNQGKISPKLLADTLQIVTKPENVQLHSLYTALPRASFDGTLQNRMQNSPVAGKVWAKTGRLDQTNSLSGFVQTKSGALLTVVVITDSYQPEFGAEIRDQLDNFMTNLARL